MVPEALEAYRPACSKTTFNCLACEITRIGSPAAACSSPADSATGCSWTNRASLVSRRIHRLLRVPPTGSSAATFTRNMASCHFRLADVRRLVLTRPSGPGANRGPIPSLALWACMESASSVRGCPWTGFTARLGILPTLPWPTSVGWCLPGPPGLAHIIPSLALRACMNVSIQAPGASRGICPPRTSGDGAWPAPNRRPCNRPNPHRSPL